MFDFSKIQKALAPQHSERIGSRVFSFDPGLRKVSHIDSRNAKSESSAYMCRGFSVGRMISTTVDGFTNTSSSVLGQLLTNTNGAGTNFDASHSGFVPCLIMCLQWP